MSPASQVFPNVLSWGIVALSYCCTFSNCPAVKHNNGILSGAMESTHHCKIIPIEGRLDYWFFSRAGDWNTYEEIQVPESDC